jgi:hypothetical protein
MSSSCSPTQADWYVSCSLPGTRVSEHPLLQGWSSKDVMRLLGISTKDKKKIREPTLVDFLQFIDAVVEVHGDPFYELRYRCARRPAFGANHADPQCLAAICSA